MTLDQAAAKSRTSFSFASSQAYTSASARSSEFEPKTRSTRVPVHLTFPVARSHASYTPSVADFRHSVHVEQVDEEVVGQRPGPVGEDAVLRLADVGAEDTQAADEHGHLGGGQRQELRPVHQQVLGRSVVPVAEVVAEAVRLRFEHGERDGVGLLLRRVGASRRERNLDVVPGALRGLLDGSAASQHDEVRERDLLLA